MNTLDKIVALLKTHHKTQKELSEHLGLTKQAVTDWIKGRSESYKKYIKEIAAFFNVSTNYLLNENATIEDETTELPWVNVLGRVAAGIPFEAIEDIIDQEQLSPDTDLSFEYFGLKIQGDSMEPKFSSGDTVIVQVQPDCENDDIVIALIDNEEAVCKKVKKTPEGIFLISTNPAYNPMFFTNKEIIERPVTILGKVVELRAKF